MHEQLFPIPEQDRDFGWRSDFFHDPETEAGVLYDIARCELSVSLVGVSVFLVFLGHLLFPKFRGTDYRFGNRRARTGFSGGCWASRGLVAVFAPTCFALYL
mgnify:CR=1 FL=1